VTAVDLADVVVLGLGRWRRSPAHWPRRDSTWRASRPSWSGEVPFWACIPSKMMIRAANLLAEARRIRAWPAPAALHPDWAPVALRIREVATDCWNDRVAVDRFIGKVVGSSAAGCSTPIRGVRCFV
jgi:pyruvate/2-oxoglutarate dehydrogenase complex dihydrolipoamide dehydrogenase (E3) component